MADTRHMRVIFTLEKVDRSRVEIPYTPFDLPHSESWLCGIKEFCDKRIALTDTERVYNFIDYDAQISSAIESCNKTIDAINDRLVTIHIPYITIENLQSDINHVHTFFVDSQRGIEGLTDIDNTLWTDLNAYLHGLEIIERAKGKPVQGQVFADLPEKTYYDIPERSYNYFTVAKTYGYCYANYPHAGRHIFEMYNARDEEAHDDHVLPMHKISGSSYLWFGKSTPWYIEKKRMYDIKRWFNSNNIDKIVNMEWNDPRLAIGWLPVAKIATDIDRSSLHGLTKLISIHII